MQLQHLHEDFKLSSYDYKLPKELIADKPLREREVSNFPDKISLSKKADSNARKVVVPTAII